MSAPGSVTAVGEDSLSLSWTGLVSVSMRWAFGRPRSPGVEQDGLPDARELGEQTRTDRSSPARRALSRMRWAICRASTQVNTCILMLCSVQWCIGRENDHDAAVLELPEGELRFGLGPVAGDHLGGGPVVVAGDQDVLAEQFLFQGGAGCLVDGPGQAQAGGLVTVQLPGDDAPHPGLAGNCLDLGFDLAPGAAGLAACQGGGKFVQLAAGLGQGGAVEPGGLAFVQLG